MNENAKMWARELPSFKQGEIAMLGGADLGYCCLGVACAIYERETGAELPRDGTLYSWGGNECLVGPFNQVREWLGLRTSAGEYDDDKPCLAEINDAGATFKEIQALILSEPEGLFL